MIGLAIFGILVLLLLLVALIPIRIEIHTEQETFCILSIGGIFHCTGQVTGQGLFFTIRIPFFRKTFNLLDLQTGGSSKNTQKHQQPRAASKRIPFIKLTKTFRVEYLEWKLDTGDFAQNAQLFPVFHFLSHNHVRITVNFNGQNSILLKAYTRVYLLALAFIKR